MHTAFLGEKFDLARGDIFKARLVLLLTLHVSLFLLQLHQRQKENLSLNEEEEELISPISL